MTKNKMINFKLKILIFFLSALIISSCGQVPSYKNLYGVWKGEHQGVDLVFRFFKDGTCTFSFKNNTSNSTELVNGTLEIDFSKKPITLTVRNIPQLNHPLHTIVEFIEIDSIRIANFAPRWRLRPISFDNNTTMHLKKVDSNPRAKI